MSEYYFALEEFIKWVKETYCKPCEEAKRDYNHCRCGSCQYDDMMRDAESFESADVQPVRHGRWGHRWVCSNMTGYEYACSCSECGKPTYRISPLEDMPPYCPNCGAYMMDGEA